MQTDSSLLPTIRANVARQTSAGEETHHGDGDRTLAVAPRNVLHHHSMFRAVDPPGRVEKPRHDAPQRHKEPGALLQPVVARSGLEAAGTFGGDGWVRLDGDFDATGLAIPMAVEADVVENEPGKMLNRVQNGLNVQLNSWSPGRGLLRSSRRPRPETARGRPGR